MMSVVVSINGTEIGTVEIVNKGPIKGHYKFPDKPGGGGMRVYVWNGWFHQHQEVRSGQVLHYRSNGAADLVASVFAQISDAKWMDQ